MDQLKALIDNWILIAQGLLASVGALAFLIAFTNSRKTLV